MCKYRRSSAVSREARLLILRERGFEELHKRLDPGTHQTPGGVQGPHHSPHRSKGGCFALFAVGHHARLGGLRRYPGVFVIGIADLTFLFALVTSGVIAFNAGALGGPILWFLAVVITPLGLPSLRK